MLQAFTSLASGLSLLFSVSAVLLGLGLCHCISSLQADSRQQVSQRGPLGARRGTGGGEGTSWFLLVYYFCHCCCTSGPLSRPGGSSSLFQLPAFVGAPQKNQPHHAFLEALTSSSWASPPILRSVSQLCDARPFPSFQLLINPALPYYSVGTPDSTCFFFLPFVLWCPLLPLLFSSSPLLSL